MVAQPPVARSKSSRWRQSKFGAVPFDPKSAERQSKAALFAWKVLGGKDAATAFLNEHDDKLGGRPLDLAIASEAGLQAVMEEIVARKFDG